MITFTHCENSTMDCAITPKLKQGSVVVSPIHHSVWPLACWIHVIILTISIPVAFTPGVEVGTSLEGNIDLDEEDTVELEFAEDTKYFADNKPVPSEISDYGDTAFLLNSVLSEKECKELLKQGEDWGFEPIAGVRDDYRDCKRITFRSQSLADVIWTRIGPHLKDIVIADDPHAVFVHGPPLLMKGCWKPKEINCLFRFCRYRPGGHFAPHFDGHYDKTNDERSLQTCMVYLNGDFEGGATNFVDEKQTLYMDESTGKYCAEEKNIIASVQPQEGLAIIFNHHRLHEGAQLRDGVKYILRTDIMYKNVDQKLDENYSKAVALLQQAETLENSGECMKAMQLYRQAFKLAPELEKTV